MPGQIKGITIEFDGETTALEAALRKVNAQARTVDAALKDVNRQLRFDPKNTELLGQKQTLLKQKIDASKTALKQFEDIEKQLKEKKVSETSAEFMKVRREIIAAQGRLKAFNAQLAQTKWQGVKNLGKGLTDVGQKLSHATRYARMFAGALAGLALYKGFQRLKSLDETSKQLEVLGYRGEKLEGIMDAVSGSVNGTKFMLQDMAKVASGALGSGVTEKYDLNAYLTKTADLAQLAGIDVESMGAMLNKAYSSGKVNARIMNQLNQHGIPIYKLLQKQLGVTSDELMEMSKKGKISFDDLYKATAKYDGLAEKMGTETLPGAVTVLTQQFGLIGADFLSGVYEPMKEGVKGIVQAIKDLRQNGTFKAWGEDVGNVVKYFVQYFKEGSASIDGLSDRAQNMVKVLSPLVQSIGGLVGMLAKLPPELQGVLVFMTLFGGPALQAVGGAVTMFANLGQNIHTMVLNTQAGIGPLGQLTAGTTGLNGAIGLLLNPLTLVALGIGAWALGMKKAYDEEHRFTQGFEEFKSASDQKLESTRAEGVELDLYKKKLDELVGKEGKSAADKQRIKTYVDKLNGAIKGLNLKYDEEKDKLNKTSEAIQKKIDKYKEAALVKAYEDLITDAAKKEAEAQLELEKLYEKRTRVQEKWNNTADKSAVAEQGYKMALGDVNREITDAKNAIKKYDGEMNKAANAVERLSGKTSTEMKKTSKAAKDEGQKTAKDYSHAIERGESEARSASAKVSKSAKNALKADSTSAGREFAQGYKNGILSQVSSIASAAAKMVGDAIRAARAKQNSGSPSKVMRTVGREYGQGYALGIGDETAPVIYAARNLIGGAIAAATIPATATASGAQGAQMQTQSQGAPRSFVNYFTINTEGDGEQVAYQIAAVLEQEARTI